MDLLRVPFGDGEIGVRDIEEADIDIFVEYWHGGGADLDFLGIDPEKLGTPEDTRARFRSFVNRGGPSQDAVGFTFFRDRRAVGYTNINILGRPKGWVHVHLTDPSARRQGFLTEIFRQSLPVISEVILRQFPITGLVLETRTRNVGINRVVQKTGFRPVATRYLEVPDGLAGPGHFHIYEVDTEAIRRLLTEQGQAHV